MQFGLAAENAKAEGLKVEMVLVGDDCSLPGEGIAGKRGIAGTVLVAKVRHNALHITCTVTAAGATAVCCSGIIPPAASMRTSVSAASWSCYTTWVSVVLLQHLDSSRGSTTNANMHSLAFASGCHETTHLVFLSCLSQLLPAIRPLQCGQGLH